MQHPFAGILPGRRPELSDLNDLEPIVAGRDKNPRPGPTTLAIGEEGAGRPPISTRALGEE